MATETAFSLQSVSICKMSNFAGLNWKLIFGLKKRYTVHAVPLVDAMVYVALPKWPI